MSARRQSAGLLVFRNTPTGIEVLLVHPGGPFWSRRDVGAWSIPKGEFDENENPLDAARREVEEETGLRTAGEYLPLEPVRQKGGKTVHAWAVRGDFDISRLKSNSFSMEWPPRSGRQQEFPEVDRAGWFGMDEAREKILPGQLGLLDQLVTRAPGQQGGEQ